MAFDWKTFIGNAAPMLATALGGPLAGAAVATLGRALGLGDAPTDEELSAALVTANPDTIAKLKQAELDFQARMAELGYKNVADIAKIEADDRDSARKREIEVHDWTPRALAFLITFGFFALIATLALIPFPEGSKEPLLILFGALSGAFGNVIGYYFGATVQPKKPVNQK
jgi:hypothetical protein